MPAFSQHHTYFFLENKRFYNLVCQNAGVFSTPEPPFSKTGGLFISFVKMPAFSQYESLFFLKTGFLFISFIKSFLNTKNLVYVKQEFFFISSIKMPCFSQHSNHPIQFLKDNYRKSPDRKPPHRVWFFPPCRDRFPPPALIGFLPTMIST